MTTLAELTAIAEKVAAQESVVRVLAEQNVPKEIAKRVERDAQYAIEKGKLDHLRRQYDVSLSGYVRQRKDY